MNSFPSLTTYPSLPLDEEYENVLIKNDYEAGYEVVRARYTKRRKSFSFKYDYLPTADKTTLESFYENTLVFGTYTFTWTHPQSSATYGVRFSEPLKFSLVLDTDGGYWQAEIKIKEP